MTEQQLLSVDEVRRRLLEIRFSPSKQRYGRRILSMNRIAAAAGLSRRLLYYITVGERDLAGHRNAHRRLSVALQNLGTNSN